VCLQCFLPAEKRQIQSTATTEKTAADEVTTM
jgi:hypothetical protein